MPDIKPLKLPQKRIPGFGKPPATTTLGTRTAPTYEDSKTRNGGVVRTTFA